MANFKRKRAKGHWVVRCSVCGANRNSIDPPAKIPGNKGRMHTSDFKQAQLYRDDEYHVAESSKGKDAAFVLR